jgi:hypothetical protein
MNGHDEERLKQLLRNALPLIEAEPEPARDLWPEMLKRLEAHPSAPPWFDWALAAGVLAVLAIFPASIPVLLYYL